MPVVATLFAVAYGAASIGFFILAGLLLVRPIHSSIGKAFLGASIASAIVYGITASLVVFPRLAVLAPLASLPVVAWCAFLIFWTKRLIPKGIAKYGAICLAVLWIIDLLIQLRVVNVPTQIFYLVHVLLGLLTLISAEQLLRNSDESVRWGVKHLILALSACAAFDIVYFGEALVTGALEPTLSVSRGILWALATPLLAVSAARNPSWELSIHVSRAVVFHTFTTLLVGVFLIVIGVMGYFVSSLGFAWGVVLQTTILFIAILGGGTILLARNARARIRGFIDRNFYSYRYDYRKEWLAFTDALMQRSDATVFSTILTAFTTLLDARGGAIYTRDTSGNMLSLRNADGLSSAPNTLTIHSVSASQPYELSAESAAIFNAANTSTDPLRKVKVVVPLTGPKGLHGVVVLTAPRSGYSLDREVLDLLSVAANQASALLRQYEVTEELLVAKQFDAFNKMSAFVVHDLKNLAAQLALLTANADQHRDNPEFQADMLETVRHVTHRMKALLEQLASGANANATERVNIVDCVRHAIASKPALKVKPALSVELEEPAFAVAHFDRLSRIFGHLIQNAAEALRDVQLPSIAISLTDSKERVVVAVSDNGSGMSESFIKDKLFRPFSSTKQTGMGIGVFESANYLREIGGTISVSSALEKGTRFEISLARAVTVS